MWQTTGPAAISVGEDLFRSCCAGSRVGLSVANDGLGTGRWLRQCSAGMGGLTYMIEKSAITGPAVAKAGKTVIRHSDYDDLQCLLLDLSI